MDLPGAAAVPDVHVGIRTGAAGDDAVPDTQAIKDPLARRRQGTDPGLEYRLGIEGFDAHRAAVEQQHLQATALQRQRPGAADHTGADNQQICRSEEHTSELQSLMRNTY